MTQLESARKLYSAPTATTLVVPANEIREWRASEHSRKHQLPLSQHYLIAVSCDLVFVPVSCHITWGSVQAPCSHWRTTSHSKVVEIRTPSSTLCLEASRSYWTLPRQKFLTPHSRRNFRRSCELRCVQQTRGKRNEKVVRG